MTRVQLGALLAVFLVGGSVAGWFRTLPKPSAIDPASMGVEWQVPRMSALERSSADMTAQIRNLKWLGDAAFSGDTDKQEWTLKAILNEEGAIIIAVGKQALISRSKVGDTLPDGSRLVALRGDTAVVELDGCRMDRHLYARAADPGPPECRTASLSKETQ